MSKVFIPQDYHTPLSVYEMQRAIEFIKSNFQTNLSNALNLRRVSAPLFVEEASGLSEEEIREIISRHTGGKVLGIFGEDTVNVLEVNIEIGQAMGLLGSEE